jgi:hypothetical protein
LVHLAHSHSVGKLFIWEVTLGKIAEKPLFGYGVGRFEAEYNNWQAEYFQKYPMEMDGPKGMAAGNTKYAFNEFLEIATETGVVGLILFLVVIVSAFLGVKKLISVCKYYYSKKLNGNLSPKHSFIIQKQITFRYNSMIINFSSQILIFFFSSFIIIMIISFPLYNIPILILFFLSLSLISSNVRAPNEYFGESVQLISE